MIRYKRAVESDAEVLASIRGEFLAEANGILCDEDKIAIEKACVRYFGKALVDESFVAWLALDGDKIVATSGICFYTIPPNKSCPNGEVAYIQNMYTYNDYRRQGIASELF